MKKTLNFVFLLSLFLFLACKSEVSPEITLSQEEYRIGSEGGVLSLPFSSNVDVSAKSTVDWMSVVSVSGSECKVQVTPNPGYDDRSGSIRFSCSEGDFSKSVVIIQGPADALILNQDVFSFDYTPQTFSITVSSNQQGMEVKITEDWIHQAQSRGMSNYTLSFSLDENLTKESREAEIILSSGSQKQRIRVQQKPTKSIPRTTEEVRESEIMDTAVEQSVQSILESYSEDTPASVIASEIENLPQVISASVDSKGEHISLVKRDSTIAVVLLHPEHFEIDVDALNSSRKRNHSSSRSSRSPLRSKAQMQKRALLLAPFYSSYKPNGENGEDAGNRTVDYKWIKQELNKVGVELDYYLDEDAGLNKFMGDTLATYDYVLILTHGGIGNRTTISANPYLICTTGQQEEPDIDPKIYGDLQTLYIKGGNKRYLVTKRFLEATIAESTRFNSTIVYLGSCDSMARSDFSDFFTDKGAAGYFGFSGHIAHVINEEVSYSLCRSLIRGMTVTKAFEYTKEDPELFSGTYASLAREEMSKFDWEIGKERYTLIDPTPFALSHSLHGKKVDLKWDVRYTTGNYQYTVLLDDKKEYSAGKNLSVTIDAGKKGEHKWTVRADLYLGDNLIDSYSSEPAKYDVGEESYFTVTTEEPMDVTTVSASIPVSYSTNITDYHIFEGGIVYSFVEVDPIIDRNYCTQIKSQVNNDPFYTKMVSLHPEVTYYVRGYVITGKSSSTPENERKVNYGDVIVFTTPPEAPYPAISGLSIVDEEGNPINSVSFEDIAVGTTVSMNIRLKNDSYHYLPVRVKSIPQGFSLNMTGEELIYPDSAPLHVIQFHPETAKIYSGSIVFDMGEDFYPVELPVFGAAYAPSDRRIQVSPNSRNFGTYYLGDEPVWRSVQIDNIGEDPVTIRNVECPEGFRCDFDGEWVIPKNGVKFLNLYFDPSIAGSYSGSVIIDSDARYGPHTVKVEGVAVDKSEETVAVTGVSLNQTSLKIDISQTVQLNATVRPDNATNKNVTWISSDDSIATVTDQGLVKGVSSGNAVITVKTEDGGYKATCSVEVKPISGSHEGTNDENWD